MENGTEAKDRAPDHATKELTVLKKIAAKAVQEHEELRKKYKLLEKKWRISEQQLNKTNHRLSITEQDFCALQSVSEAACQDFTELQIQLEVESQCRVTAESFASRMVKENREIKRKSTAFLSRSANPDFARQYTLALEDDEHELSSDGEGSAESIEIQSLRALADDFKEQLIATKRDLAIVAEERDIAREELGNAHHQQQTLAAQDVPENEESTEDQQGPMQDAILELVKLRKEHEITKAALAESEQTLAQFRRVSTLAYQELQDVQEKYTEEVVLREKAEDFASKMYQEKQAADAYKRQSLVMLDEAIGDDEKLQDALAKVEELTKCIEEERQRHKEQMEEVNSKLSEASSVEHLDSLETKLSIAKEENEALEHKVNELQSRNRLLESEANKSSMMPVPPPPPPPPPPPVLSQPKNPLEVLRRIIGNRKGHTSPDGKIKGKDPNQKVYEATIDEMMKRIKSGKVQLKPVETQWKAEYKDSNHNEFQEKTLLNRGRGSRLGSVKKTPAMNQLNGLVTNLKKRKPGETSPTDEDPPQAAGASNEFMRIMQRRRQRSEQIAPKSDKPLVASQNAAKTEETGTERKLSKPVPPTPAPRSASNRLTKSASLDSGITDQTPNKKTLEEQTSDSSIQTCPEGDTGSVLTDSDRGSAGDIQLQTNPAFEENYIDGDESYSSIGDIQTTEMSQTMPASNTSQDWIYSALDDL